MINKPRGSHLKVFHNEELPHLTEKECAPGGQIVREQLKHARQQQELQAEYQGRERNFPSGQ